MAIYKNGRKIATNLQSVSKTGTGNAITGIELNPDGTILSTTLGNTFVDVDSDQIITGAKTFSNGLYTGYINHSGTLGIGTNDEIVSYSMSNKEFVPIKNTVTLGNKSYYWGNAYLGTILSSGQVNTNKKFTAWDTITGGILGADGNLYLTSSSSPTIYFSNSNSEGITNSLKSTISGVSVNHRFFSNNKTGAYDGTAGCVLDAGAIFLTHAADPYIVFSNNNVADATNILKSTKAGIIASGSIYTNNKTTSSDGLSGCVFGGGNIHLNSATSPTLFFYDKNATSSQAYLAVNSTTFAFHKNDGHNCIISGQNFYPETSGQMNLGHGSYRWGNLYSTNINNLDAINTNTIFASSATPICLTYGNYNTYFHRSGDLFYILISDYGGDVWNSLRPFRIDLKTGIVSLSQGLRSTNGDFSGNITVNNITAGGAMYTHGRYLISDGLTGNIFGSGFIYIGNASGNSGLNLYRQGSTTPTASIVNTATNTIATQHIVPDTNNIWTIGSASALWNGIYASNGIFTATNTNSLNVAGAATFTNRPSVNGVGLATLDDIPTNFITTDTFRNVETEVEVLQEKIVALESEVKELKNQLPN